MQVLLINPPNYSSLTARVGWQFPPLGLLYIASILRQAGILPTIIDLSIQDGTDAIDFSPYQAIGISSDTPRFNSAMKLAQQAHAAGKMVFMGGLHPTFRDTEVLESGYVHYVVRREGELTVLELLKNFCEKKYDLRPEEIMGLSWKNRKGKTKQSSDRPFIEDLDTLPLPARDLIPLSYYPKRMGKRKVTSIISSRGCPNQCSFCSCNVMAGVRWRSRSLEAILDEIALLERDYGINAVGFADDNFTLDASRVWNFTEKILQRQIDVHWFCSATPEKIARNEELVKQMARAGCRYVYLGIESGAEKQLKGYNKKTTVETGVQAITLLKKCNIKAIASFVIGGIDETYDDIMKTLKYAIRLNPPTVQFCLLTPYPGTQIYKKHQDRIVTKDWSKYDIMHAVLRTNHFSPEELQKILKKLYIRFYFRPRRLPTLLKNLIRGTLIPRGINKVKATIESAESSTEQGSV
jgi:anaerobic magnesium-protoporphyrin IX monomethyl ester cyclase